ncbi:TPA: hypothetical protein NHK58_001421 [Pseudomonas aeruginosa]|nr:hypothetical protein [Pseudomonas aeruginosa]
MFYITKNREEKNYKQYFEERGRTLFEYLDRFEEAGKTTEAIKELVNALDNEDFLKYFRETLSYDNQCGVSHSLKQLVEEPDYFIESLIRNLNYNIQEIYKTNNNSAILSINGQYYSSENIDGLVKFKRLDGVQTFQGMEFDFSDKENTRTLLEIMLDKNSSYHKTEEMSKHQAIKYLTRLVSANVYYLEDNEVYEFIKTFDINDKSYIDRDFLKFSKEANEYISSIISKIIPYRTDEMLKDLRVLSNNQFIGIEYEKSKTQEQLDEFVNNAENQYKFPNQVKMDDFMREQLANNGFRKAKEFDIKEMRKRAGIYKSKEAKRIKAEAKRIYNSFK